MSERPPTTQDPEPPDQPEAQPSAETQDDAANAAGEPRKTITVVCLLVVIAVALASIGRSVYTSYLKPGSDMPPDAEMRGQGPPPESVGSPDAPIHIEACMGPALTPIMEALAQVARDHPDAIRADFLPYLSPEGQAFCRDHGQELACIFVNGSNEFVIDTGDGEKRIRFHGPPGETYAVEDIGNVLASVYDEACGPAPEHFAETVTGLIMGSGQPPPPPR